MPNVEKEVATSAVAAEAKEVKKVVRRGVAGARGTTRLKFSHEQAKQNGLFLAHLDSVTVDTIKIGEDTTGMPSFNGLEIPRLRIVFASNEEDANKRHYVTLSFNAVESNANTIPGGKEAWKVDTVFDWIKHIMNVYVLRGREFNEEEEAALALPFVDFAENGEYIPIEPEEVIAGWKTLFDNFENIMNRGRDGQPYFNSIKDGKSIPVWIKLIRYIRNKKGWTAIANGQMSFPTFVGEGCVEVFSAKSAPSIRLDATRESIIPMKVETAKTPNMPTPAGIGGIGSVMGGVPVVDPMSSGQNFGAIASEAAEDMPF